MHRPVKTSTFLRSAAVLTADGNRVNMYASAWICTKTSTLPDLASGDEVSRRSRTGALERLDLGRPAV